MHNNKRILMLLSFRVGLLRTTGAETSVLYS